MWAGCAAYGQPAREAQPGARAGSQRWRDTENGTQAHAQAQAHSHSHSHSVRLLPCRVLIRNGGPLCCGPTLHRWQLGAGAEGDNARLRVVPGSQHLDAAVRHQCLSHLTPCRCRRRRCWCRYRMRIRAQTIIGSYPSLLFGEPQLLHVEALGHLPSSRCHGGGALCGICIAHSSCSYSGAQCRAPIAVGSDLAPLLASRVHVTIRVFSPAGDHHRGWSARSAQCAAAWCVAAPRTGRLGC